MDTATPVYAEAYHQSRFPNSDELDALRRFVSHAHRRVEAIQEVSNHSDSLIEESCKTISNYFPQYISTTEDKEKCKRDIDYFLRGITYCVVAESTEPLDEYFLNGIEELYSTLNLQAECLTLALNAILESDLLSKQSSEIISPYIKHIISVIIPTKHFQKVSNVELNKSSSKWPDKLASFYGIIQDDSFERQPQSEIGLS